MIMTSPARPAPPLPAASTPAASTNSKGWRGLSPAQVEESRQIGLRIRQSQQQYRDEGTKPTLAKPDNGATSAALPQEGDKD